MKDFHHHNVIRLLGEKHALVNTLEILIMEWKHSDIKDYVVASRILKGIWSSQSSLHDLQDGLLMEKCKQIKEKKEKKRYIFRLQGTAIVQCSNMWCHGVGWL